MPTCQSWARPHRPLKGSSRTDGATRDDLVVQQNNRICTCHVSDKGWELIAKANAHRRMQREDPRPKPTRRRVIFMLRAGCSKSCITLAGMSLFKRLLHRHSRYENGICWQTLNVLVWTRRYIHNKYIQPEPNDGDFFIHRLQQHICLCWFGRHIVKVHFGGTC